MTRCNHYLCTSCLNLLCLYSIAFCLMGSPVRQSSQPTTGIAAEIVLPVRVHLCEIFTRRIDKVSEFICCSRPPYNITGILESNRLLNLFRLIYLDPPTLEKFIVKFTGLHHFEWEIFPSQHRRRHITCGKTW